MAEPIVFPSTTTFMCGPTPFASVAEADLLVSWNFRHIVHFDKIRLFNSVNLELGYKPLQIYSPREVTKTEGD